MSENRFKLSAAVYLILMKDDKVLLLRRYNTGWSDGLYSLPAGHIDGQEPMSAALCREAKEEAGVTIRPEDVDFAHVMHRYDGDGDKREYIDFFFTARAFEGEPYNAEPHKCDDLAWFPVNSLPDNILPYVRKVIEDYRTGTHFSQVGW